jgi:hypothetical protein
MSLPHSNLKESKMEQIGFESARERIRKAFGRPAIAPAPVVIEVKANPPCPWGEPGVHVNRPPFSRRGVGPVVLGAAACVALFVGFHDKVRALVAPFNATAPAAETWTPVADDDTTTLEDHVTGDALDARCEKLWTFLDTQIDISNMEARKPGFTAAYRSANHLGELTALQIRSQGCLLKDPATFEAQLAAIHALNQMMQ